MLGFSPLASAPLGDDGVESEVHSLVPLDITTGQPVLGTPSVSQVHSLVPLDITTGQPVLGTPSVSQVHSLVPLDITTGQPVLGTPSVSQVFSLVPLDITTGHPTVGSAYLDGSLRRVVSVTGNSRNTVELFEIFNSASISNGVNSATVVKTNNKAA
jgi:hypothetical protein